MSLTKKVLAGSYFQILINVFQRLIGIISTIILARLLTPNDFGIIAILAITVHLIDILSDAGSQQYIIQKQSINDDDVNTAWTIDIIGKVFLTLVIWLLAPLIADTLNNPLLTNAIRIVSLSIPLRALKNPGLILLAKNLQYQKLFKLGMYQKFLSFASVMIFVLISPSYWAIIVGDIVSATIYLVGSYYIDSFKPRLTLKKVVEQWRFSQWALLRGITGFLRSQADILIVSKFFPTASLGSYHMTRELALIPALSVIIPATEPLLSAISQSKHDRELLNYRIRLSLVTLIAILLPLSVFIYLYSQEIVTVVLGEQWIEYHQLLGFFSIMFFTFCLHALISDCFTALNKMRKLFYFDLLSTIFIITILMLSTKSTVFEFSLIRGIAGFAITGTLLVILERLTLFGLKKLAQNTLPSFIACILAVLITMQLEKLGLQDLHPFVGLTLISAIFFSVYTLLFFLVSFSAQTKLNENTQLLHSIVDMGRSSFNTLKNKVKNKL
ncbi:MAG: oligosaccharide flippase family protein [Gammaproteobacteria bacterium]|nr:oligosaccharide flippase family protein [Gammaproteobacteria bacterium]